MEIIISDQHIFLFDDNLNFHDAKARAWEKKMTAFDVISKFSGILTHPKDDDFELTYSEHRYQPFWHVTTKAHYVYDRNADYKIETGGSEVKSVTCMEKHFESSNGQVCFSVIEHCIQEEENEIYVEAITGKTQPELSNYLSFSHNKITGELHETVNKDSILVPPQMRVSAIMRNMLSGIIKGIQADKIYEETIKVPSIDLYYRPVYAFQYRWKSKGKEAIIEIDALTGAVKSGNKIFREYLGKVMDQDFLFDLGADAASLLIPGGSIAVKAAKKYIDIHKDKNKQVKNV